eukprot:scaffold18131_cov39-Prasinocladus_malaysianus.AAC.2
MGALPAVRKRAARARCSLPSVNPGLSGGISRTPATAGEMLSETSVGSPGEPSWSLSRARPLHRRITSPEESAASESAAPSMVHPLNSCTFSVSESHDARLQDFPQQKYQKTNLDLAANNHSSMRR